MNSNRRSFITLMTSGSLLFLTFNVSILVSSVYVIERLTDRFATEWQDAKRLSELAGRYAAIIAHSSDAVINKDWEEGAFLKHLDGSDEGQAAAQLQTILKQLAQSCNVQVSSSRNIAEREIGRAHLTGQHLQLTASNNNLYKLIQKIETYDIPLAVISLSIEGPSNLIPDRQLLLDAQLDVYAARSF